ncbi:MAG: hypothetical protein AAF215_08445 [Cyanobacteria bacterium P01_A01_bin.123]
MIVIVAAIKVSDRCTQKFVDVNIVEAGHIDAVKLAIEFWGLSPPESTDAAVFAEEVVIAGGRTSIIVNVKFAREQSKGVIQILSF